jgi:dUTP pyrophosphatase
VNRVSVRIARVRPDRDSDLPLPKAATAGSVGVDLFASIEGELVLGPGDRVAVPTGVAVAIPPGYEGQVRPRSGLARRHGLTLLNAPGTIDSDYRGEIQVLLLNAGREPVVIHRGERVAQLVIAPVVIPDWEEVESPEALGVTPRGPGGFGHTGR